MSKKSIPSAVCLNCVIFSLEVVNPTRTGSFVKAHVFLSLLDLTEASQWESFLSRAVVCMGAWGTKLSG
jgi:hypothetical protein